METEEILESIGNLSLQIETLQTALTSTAGVEVVSGLPHTITSGHNMFGYTGSNGIPTAEAFINATGGNASILDRISIVKNDAGAFYMPSQDYDQIGSLVNGAGYYLFNEGEPFVVTWI